jgi:hypothetical protein
MATIEKAYIRILSKEMADGQPSFLYDEQQLEVLEKYISPERLRMYIATVKIWADPNDRLRKAIKLYEKNTSLSEVMYTVVQGFEITFRNAIHNRLSVDRNSAWWFDTMELSASEKDSVVRAKQMIEEKHQELTPDRVVGELSFGFWVRLFSGEYTETLWNPSLMHILPSGLERGAVYMRFKDLKTLRNRIAHHNRIIGRSLTVWESYEQMLETIGWFSPTMKAWVEATNSVPLRARPLVPRQKAKLLARPQ